MYHHVDQSWRKMPAFLSIENEDWLASRIANYAQLVTLRRVLVIFHGGEPLLAGIETLERITTKVRNATSSEISIDFSIQTNGTLLTEEFLNKFEDLNISVSLSLDGPEEIHNKHRKDHAGKPSFQKVEAALKMLVKRPKIFSGVIAVVDPDISPRELLQYFSNYEIPNLDFLLPDGNHRHPPPKRHESPEIYNKWLIECFDLWFDEFSHMRLRFFDAILDALVGLPSKTDALGFGDVSLLTIETDGSYHDLDVLKITYEGASNLQLGTLASKSIEQAIQSSQIQRHRRLLQKEGLSKKCQSCNVVDICAGGAVPHRYSEDGFINPSIYCEELFDLISHAKSRLNEQLEAEIEATKLTTETLTKDDLASFEDIARSYQILVNMVSILGEDQVVQLKTALEIVASIRPEFQETIMKLLALRIEQLKILSLSPSVFAWTKITIASIHGEPVTSIDGKIIEAEYDYVNKIASLLDIEEDVQRINRNDFWLRAPFGEKILYEDKETTEAGMKVLHEAYELINSWDNNLLKEIKLIAPELQFIKDTTAHPDKIVSFSDNSVPGALFVTIKLGDKFIDAANLADSILHEYRHQKLYLLQRISDIIAVDVPLVVSPWREELRPPTGLFHAIYVFTFLRKFWKFLSLTEIGIAKTRAEKEVGIITERIYQGVKTLRQTKLTLTGTLLLEILEEDQSN